MLLRTTRENKRTMQEARKLRVQKTVIAESAEVHPPPLSQREGGGCRGSEDQVGEPSWRPTGEPKEAGPVGGAS